MEKIIRQSPRLEERFLGLLFNLHPGTQETRSRRSACEGRLAAQKRPAVRRVAASCAAPAETLLESELSCRVSVRWRRLQADLLRVLQERSFYQSRRA
jgi:hypothetical protein